MPRDMCAEVARDMQHNRRSGMPRDMFEAQMRLKRVRLKGEQSIFYSIPLNLFFGTFGLQKYILVLPYLTSKLFCLFAGSENGRGDRGAEAAVI